MSSVTDTTSPRASEMEDTARAVTIKHQTREMWEPVVDPRSTMGSYQELIDNARVAIDDVEICAIGAGIFIWRSGNASLHRY